MNTSLKRSDMTRVSYWVSQSLTCH